MNYSDTIIISPIGDIPSWINTAISERIEKIFSFQARIESLMDDISFAYDESRDQYYSTMILEVLEKKAPEGCVKVLAITKEDLFIPILTHVYGEAQLGGKACIVSISRLVGYSDSESFEEGRNRMIKEAAHELGHTFDLRHCEDPMCMMHYCRKIEDVDHKSASFCRYCKVLLSDSIRLLEK